MRARAKRRLRALALSLRSVTVTERVVVPCVTRSFARTGVPELTLRAVRESIENVTLLVAAAARLIVRWRLLRLVVLVAALQKAFGTAVRGRVALYTAVGSQLANDVRRLERRLAGEAG